MQQIHHELGQSGLSPEQLNRIAAAARILNEGGTVAFPTETVYGLGADATNAAAVHKIYKIKQRPANHPLIVHIHAISQLDYWARAIPESAWKLASHFWPGPLTLILQRSRHILDDVTGGQNTVGIRIPAHPIALALLDILGPQKALAAPSANRFGRISPTSAAHVQQELGNNVDMILDGGSCEVGLESTIVSFHEQSPMILRPGGISLSAIKAVLDEPVVVANTTNHTIRTPGSLLAHYAPTTPLRLFPTTQIWQQASILAAQNLHVLVITWSGTHKPHSINQSIEQFVMPADPIDYGKQLYAKLRQFDEAAFDYLLVEAPPEHPNWLAIADRLQRANHHTSDHNQHQLI